MRVLMATRPDYLRVAGGDTVQLLRTRAALEALGVSVEVVAGLPETVADYDLVHVFNLTRPEDALHQAWRAQAAEKPVILSTIYWDMEEFWLRGDPDEPTDPREAETWRAMKVAELGLLRAQARAVVTLSDWFLPNARAEGQLVTEQLGAPADRHTVTALGVDEVFSHGEAERFAQAHGLREFVLCVGRIDRRKNQVALLEAVHDTGLPVVCIGDASHPRYLDRCRALAGEGVRFLPAMPPEQLADAYAAARVHALPSWYETPGLVSLEAAAAGCAVVSTDRGSAREYFGDAAHYCDPTDTASIRRAVLAAWETPADPGLADLVRTRYTWDAAAAHTREGYTRALAGRAATPIEAAGAWVARGAALLELSDAWQHFDTAVRTHLEEYIEFLRTVPRELHAEIDRRGATIEELLRRVEELHEEVKVREEFVAQVQQSRAYRTLQFLKRLARLGRGGE